MYPALSLLCCALLPAAPPGLDNLDFGTGRLTNWQGEGFYVTTATGRSPGLSFGVCSSDGDRPGHTGMLYRTFVVPPGVGTIHFTGYATTGEDGLPDNQLNIYLEAARREIVPKLVLTAEGYQPSPHLLAPLKGRPREYVWHVADRAGQTLRIVLLDHNKEPGRHVFCSGFRTEPPGQFDSREFSRYMQHLTRKHRLSPLTPRFQSKHFIALGNTDEAFTQTQLERCELLYQHFLSHFRHKGFRLSAPPSKLMVALFDRQEGFEAYLGGVVPPMITGIYHPPSNRLVVYDFGRNRALLKNREQVEQFARTLPTDPQRTIVLGTMNRQASDIRADANLATIMHEAAHQMSFNTGMVSRGGDHPLWLVEGLATYCESTEQGFWKGIGEPNPERLRPLAAAQRGELTFLPVRSLIESDQWLRGPGGQRRTLIGYAQSWALFRMLMEEQPRAMRQYFELIYPRRTPDHRLADFVEVFGTDLEKLERRHRAYIKRITEGIR